MHRLANEQPKEEEEGEKQKYCCNPKTWQFFRLKRFVCARSFLFLHFILLVHSFLLYSFSRLFGFHLVARKKKPSYLEQFLACVCLFLSEMFLISNIFNIIKISALFPYKTAVCMHV